MVHQGGRLKVAGLRALALAALVLVSVAGCTTVSHKTHTDTAVAVAHQTGPYLDAQTLDLVDYLPPPPADDSLVTKEDLKTVLALQKSRTPQQVARAQADVVNEVWRFSDVVGNPKFTKENLPKVDALFKRSFETMVAIVDPAKAKWNRPRPFLFSKLVTPVVERLKSASYPSGHSTNGTFMGLTLARMIPEKRTEIMARAQEFAYNRVVAGAHFPSDVAAGQRTATAIAAVLYARPDFQNDFAEAKKELRAALELK